MLTLSIPALKAALVEFCKIAPAKCTTGLGSAVRIVGAPDMATITATDFDAWLSCEFPAACDGNAAPVVVNARALKDAVASLAKAKADSVTIRDIGGAVTLQAADGSGATIRLVQEKLRAEFPNPPATFTYGDEFAVPSDIFAHDVARVLPCASTEQTRYYLGGILSHYYDKGDRLVWRLAATDGHRLAVVEREKTADMPEAMPDAILPRPVLKVLQAVMAKAKADTLRLSVGKVATRYRSGRWTLEARNVDGTFPDYSRVIPGSTESVALFDPDTFARAVDGATAHLSAVVPACDITIGRDWMIAAGVDPDNGKAMATVDGATAALAPGKDGPVEFDHLCVNANYLADVMKAFGGADIIALRWNDPAAPMIFDSAAAPEFRIVQMPLRSAHGATTPGDMAKANMDPIERLKDGAPGLLETIRETDIPGRSKIRRRDLAKLVRDAIAFRIERGQEPALARLLCLYDVANVDSVTWQADSARIIAKIEAFGRKGSFAEFIARVAPLERTETPAPVATDPEPVDMPEPEPVAAPEPVADIEPTDETPAPAPAPAPAAQDAPALYGSMVEFKAAASVGSRWIIERYRDGEWIVSEGEQGADGDPVRTIVTVRARDIGMVRGDATADDYEIGKESGGGGRTWLNIPKANEWRSDGVGMIWLYHNGTPNLRLRPAPLPAAQAAVSEGDGDLRAMVEAMAARLAALESAAAPESPVEAPAPVMIEESHCDARSVAQARVLRQAAAYRSTITALKQELAQARARTASLQRQRALQGEASALTIAGVNA